MPFSSPNYQPLKPDFILINAQLYNVVKLSINNVHYYKSSQINNFYDGKWIGNENNDGKWIGSENDDGKWIGNENDDGKWNRNERDNVEQNRGERDDENGIGVKNM